MKIIVAVVTIAATVGGESRTRVTINERQAILGLAPMRASIVARIDNPTHEWYCPEVTVTWNDGTLSGRLSDCDPLEDLPEGWAFTSDEIVRVLGPGDHVIEVELRQGAKTRLFELRAEISG